ncbi:A24 family peptidase [Helicobacter cappadocius]|uniref:A24 family peptidase n=1 Tax=Helicobacter cappadocius TaxID=3063998 RepID=A0AA90PRB8_9HELI|nr:MULTISPECIES: A24 family peptidase [unclassified Helicobacter]MDO7253573.1 A24 family peptidase [Helicobacter sp. faydin-H75]MDP2539501.1 A24 family peptidase [Helicobacter sp. faydin-H76]
MLIGFFDSDKTTLLYQYLSSPNLFDLNALWLSILGVVIFLTTQLLFYIQKRKPKTDFTFLQNLFFSKTESVFLVLIFFAGGIGIAYLYGGIFQIWLMVVFSFLVLLSAIDYKVLAVPDWINFVLFVCVLVGMIYFSQNFWDILLGGLSIAGMFSILRIFGDMIWHKEVLGEGDIVFGASVGMLLGVYGSLMSIFWGCVFASIYSVLVRFFGKKITKLPLIMIIFIGLLFYFLMGIIND